MTSPVIGTPWKKLNAPVSEEAIEGVDKYWRAANYLSIGQIYLRSNPLMKEPFTREDVKHRLVGHWGTTPGLNFLIGHINRLIADHQQNTVIIMGPGHGGPAGTAQSYLDGTYTEYFPNITKDEAGLQKFFRQFSYPGGIPSHYAPETPGSIHEGGELGYALSHAYGAVMNNPSLFVPAIVGDGEAETGPLATGWQSNKLINPRTDGIVLPASAVLASLALPHAPSPIMSRPATAVAIVFLYMVSFFPWLICIKNSISWRFRFECLVRIVVGSHTEILRTGSDTIHQIIGDLVWRSRYSSGVPSSSSSLLYEASITALGSASINSHVFKNASSGMDGFALIHLEYPPLECPRISATFVCEMECFANSPFSSSPTSCAKRRLRYSLLSLM